jgi:hypothetical protein
MGAAAAQGRGRGSSAHQLFSRDRRRRRRPLQSFDASGGRFPPRQGRSGITQCAKERLLERNQELAEIDAALAAGRR